MISRFIGQVAGLAIAIGVAGGIATESQAATESGVFSVRGLGAERCSDLVQTLNTEESSPAAYNALGHWIAGYLTQANRSASDVFEIVPVMDVAVLVRLVENLCNANPDSLIESAAAGVISSFLPVSQKTETPFVEAKNADYAANVRREVLRQAQIALIEEGFLPARSADGDYGPRTRKAFAAYQEKIGLTVTGVPDPVTLVSLFLDRTGR